MFKVMYYSSLQSNSSLLNLVLSSIKWPLPDPTRPKEDLKIKEAASIYGYKPIQALASMEKKIVSEYSFGS